MRYLYLCLGLVQLVGVAVVWVARRDLRPVIYAAGAAGAIIETGAEVWYLRDYWRPPTITPWVTIHGQRWPLIEDAIYGFGVTALAACAVPFVVSLWPGQRLVYSHNRLEVDRRGQLPIIAVLAVVVMTIDAQFGSSSIWSAVWCFGVVAVYGVILRPDLIVVGLGAAVLIGLLALVGYAGGLDWIVDGRSYLDRVLVHAGTRWDVRILGQVPLDEVAWNVARGACIAVMYPFLTGRRLCFVRSVPPAKSNLV